MSSGPHPRSRSPKSTLLLAGFLLASCARRMPPHATALDAQRANVELGQLEEGRSLVVAKCGSRCHKPPLPTDHVRADWPKTLDVMGPRANLTPQDRHLIEQYMVAMTVR